MKNFPALNRALQTFLGPGAGSNRAESEPTPFFYSFSLVSGDYAQGAGIRKGEMKMNTTGQR